jgi:alpha,alpha-trehalase
MSGWSLVYDGFDPAQEPLREALCTLGNGYFATRGAAPEAAADDVHYPGTYVAGLFDRLTTPIAGRDVENEDLVNAPNWLPFSFRRPDHDWWRVGDADLLEYQQELDLRQGVLTRTWRTRDDEGRVTSVRQRRLVSMADPHVAALETRFLAENWSGPLEIRSGIDGTVTNSGVARYRQLHGDHLDQVGSGEAGEDAVWLAVSTRGSKRRLAVAIANRLPNNAGVVRQLISEPGWIGHRLVVELMGGQATVVEKIAGLFTDRDSAAYEPSVDAATWIKRAPDFGSLLAGHVRAWSGLWNRFDTGVEGSQRAQMILRLHVFHLLQTVSPNTIGLDVGVPARGLHGEAYRGHIFWDELFILPFINLRMPVLSRALLEYRYRRLPEARQAALEAGHSGAMFPWQSGSSGREESQRLHLNPRSGRWLPDNSRLQRHIGSAVAYNAWRHYQATGDMEFLRFRGAPLIIEVARFWSSIATLDEATGRFAIRGVMGPDEYHDAYPDAAEPGLNNNAYTNVMAAWVMCRALDVRDILVGSDRDELWRSLDLRQEDIDRFDELSRRLLVPFHDGVISQFEGYGGLAEFDWEAYRAKYGDIHRLDRILEAEGDSPNRYKVSKQSDVLMLFYLLSAAELETLLGRLGYAFEAAADIRRNVDYYLARTSHGSTLSRLVHAWVLARLDRAESWRHFEAALESDVADVQGGTTPEGIHLGAMAGSVDLVQRSYAGVEVADGVLVINPGLPDELERVALTVHHRGQRLHIEADHREVSVRSVPRRAAPIQVRLVTMETELRPGESHVMTLP